MITYTKRHKKVTWAQSLHLYLQSLVVFQQAVDVVLLFVRPELVISELCLFLLFFSFSLFFFFLQLLPSELLGLLLFHLLAVHLSDHLFHVGVMAVVVVIVVVIIVVVLLAQDVSPLC